jgi:hypothetical protein
MVEQNFQTDQYSLLPYLICSAGMIVMNVEQMKAWNVVYLKVLS